jgi:hypothetical protein
MATASDLVLDRALQEGVTRRFGSGHREYRPQHTLVNNNRHLMRGTLSTIQLTEEQSARFTTVVR